MGTGNAETDRELGGLRKIPPLGTDVGRGFLYGPFGEGPIQVIDTVAASDPTSPHKCNIRFESLRFAQPLKATEVTVGNAHQRLVLLGNRPVVISGPRNSGVGTLMHKLAAECESPLTIPGKSIKDRAQLTHHLERIERSAKTLIIEDLDTLERSFPIEASTLVDCALSMGLLIIASVSTQSLVQAFRGATYTLTEDCIGVLLRGTEPVPRELFGVPLHMAVDPEPYAGRAVVVLEGHAYAARTWFR